MNDINSVLKIYADMIETALENFLPKKGECPNIIREAVAYSLLGGGKRIRPALVMEFHRIFGKDPRDVLPFACAIEMIHTYSLIHDDLPCMDNDLMRRGKPSCHAAFGEANALLAGDALLTLAFQTAAKADSHVLSYKNTLDCIAVLSYAAGMCGMIGGQTLDLEAENRQITFEELKKLQYGKTGMMIIAAAKIGCIAAGADDNSIACAQLYATRIGQVFQMVDDVLDVIADEKELGKPVNSDKKNNKTTFVSLFGIDKTMQMCRQLNEEAKSSLLPFGENAKNLTALADMLLNRMK